MILHLNMLIVASLKMKIVYTILFFIDTFVLILLAIFFLNLMDKKGGVINMVFAILGIVICVIVLGILLTRYFKMPPPDKEK